MLPSGRPIHVTKSGVVHRKKCRHPKTPADLMHRYCLVCGCKAENYNFGVISCESCKAFFRRNAHKQTLGEAGFACSFRRGGCEVSLATRKKCPGCRLAKCFAVGMQAELIQRADQLLAMPQPQPPPLMLPCADQSLSSSLLSAFPSRSMSISSSVSSFGPAFHRGLPQKEQHQPPLPPPPPMLQLPLIPPPPLQHYLQQQQQQQQQPQQHQQQQQQPNISSFPNPAQLDDALSNPEHGDHLLRLWQRLQSPDQSLLPSFYTEPSASGQPAGDHRFANVLLVDFFTELRLLVRDTMVCDIGASSMTNVAILEAFVHQAAKFIAGLRQMDQMDRSHFLTLLRCRLHSVLFPLSCAGYCLEDERFYFTIQGQRRKCQPIQLFIDLVRQASNRFVDFTPLAEFNTYTRLLLEVTEMRPELLALYCAAKLLYLPPKETGITDQRMIDACARLGLRYHQHLVDSLYYHYPFDFDNKLRACCRLFKWSLGFDRTLQSFIQYCPLTVDNYCVSSSSSSKAANLATEEF